MNRKSISRQNLRFGSRTKFTTEQRWQSKPGMQVHCIGGQREGHHGSVVGSLLESFILAEFLSFYWSIPTIERKLLQKPFPSSKMNMNIIGVVKRIIYAKVTYTQFTFTILVLSKHGGQTIPHTLQHINYT